MATEAYLNLIRNTLTTFEILLLGLGAVVLAFCFSPVEAAENPTLPIDRMHAADGALAVAVGPASCRAETAQ